MASDNNCRVCGYDWGEPPWGPYGDTPNFWICPCCEVEAGYEDGTAESARSYRAEWLAAGAKWTIRTIAHDGLTTEERLKNVPPGFE
ncbi:MAG: hypothetical protein H0X12_14815 [Nocardioides sp.]|nr:hypothetical protein [Nocardioides sp.]